MKKIFVIMLALFVCVAAVSAQSWQNLTKATGETKKFAQQVLKERVTYSDSTTFYKIVDTDTTIRIKLGTLPARSMITGVQVYVNEAFNQIHGSKKDSISIGSAYDVDAYMSKLAVSSTGVKSGSLTSLRYVAADSVLYLYFLRQGVYVAKAGDVCAGIEFVEFPR
jgi:hypothetical protein